MRVSMQPWPAASPRLDSATMLTVNPGKLLIFAGLGLAALGVIVLLGPKLGIRLFNLPGDIVWRGKNTTLYFPIVTSIVLSVLLTLVLSWFGKR